jgi:signal transduction histidine kinase/CHASE3 domain sensor protein
MVNVRLVWWDRLRVQQKVWSILLVVLVPLFLALAVQVSLINHLLEIQQEHRQTVSARQQILILRRLAVDIEDAFRGYLLVPRDAFLKPLAEAEPKIRPTVDRAIALAGSIPGLAGDIRIVDERLRTLLESKQALIGQVRAGDMEQVLDYVRSGQGLAISDALRADLRKMEDYLDQRAQSFEVNRESLAHRIFWGLLVVVAGTLGLGLLGARLLTQSITNPLGALQASAQRLGRDAAGLNEKMVPIAITSSDEIGHLARSFEAMAGRVKQQILEMEAIAATGHEINSIGPDGLDGVLRRITDRAAELLQADVCLVMIRNEQMGCWIVEAASGNWHDRLYKSVMLWEEFPVSVRAFESREPATGEDLRKDVRPEVVRRNLIGESMLALPLLAQGESFGVLTLLQERVVHAENWNLRLAKGFAGEAAMAISNARLYEAVYEKEKGLEKRLRQLEHLAESLAHDLKAPGERVEGLATLLVKEYGGRLDARANHWIQLLERNGKDLIQRVEGILEVARVGAQRTSIEAVDPVFVIEQVLKARSGELESRQVRVSVVNGFPLVACHRAYLRQVFDNLISNAIKFAGDREDFQIRLCAERDADRLRVSVEDNGIGIPQEQRERVFEPFVRLNPNGSKGSGIGLAIVKRIVELYGGNVWAETNERGGCTIRFTLPLLGDLTNAPDTTNGEIRREDQNDQRHT